MEEVIFFFYEEEPSSSSKSETENEHEDENDEEHQHQATLTLTLTTNKYYGRTPWRTSEHNYDNELQTRKREEAEQGNKRKVVTLTETLTVGKPCEGNEKAVPQPPRCGLSDLLRANLPDPCHTSARLQVSSWAGLFCKCIEVVNNDEQGRRISPVGTCKEQYCPVLICKLANGKKLKTETPWNSLEPWISSWQKPTLRTVGALLSSPNSGHLARRRRPGEGRQPQLSQPGPGEKPSAASAHPRPVRHAGRFRRRQVHAAALLSRQTRHAHAS